MRLATVGVLGLVVAAFAVYVLEAEPTWYERARYPLRYEHIVVGHAENYELEPQLVAAVIYQDLHNPELNIRYGSWYLRHLLDKYGDEELALAAYNAGQANVDRWRDEGQGIQFAETRHYVDRVRELKTVYANAYPAELGLP